MKRPGFLEGVVVALAASLGGSMLFSTLGLFMNGSQSLYLVIGVLGLAYLLYLLGRSPHRVGRITTAAIWLGLSALSLMLDLPLSVFLVGHLLGLSLVRSLFFHSSPLSALADLALSVLSLAAAIWAFLHTGSLFLTIWCLFLVQALYGVIPCCLPHKVDAVGATQDNKSRFEQAHRSARSALRKLSTLH